MDVAVASLLIRQHMALIEEGIGPADGQPEQDMAILRQAVGVAGHLFDHDHLCDVWLGCPRDGQRQCVQTGGPYPAHAAA